MRPHRYGLRLSEQRKLITISHADIDSMARNRSLKQEREAARQDASRQALRQALSRA